MAAGARGDAMSPTAPFSIALLAKRWLITSCSVMPP